MPSQVQDARAGQVRLIADAARAKVGDRIEGAKREGRSWRTAFWGAFALLAAAVGALGFVALQPRFVPYVVAVDEHGVAVPIGPARRTTDGDPNAVRAELTRWIGYARTVSSDPHAQTEMVERAYAYATPATANGLSAYF
ncbi:MAG TPA: VirB8/TrbF family protein, partial [Longimicrobiaceae bacterium]|nr:VirB8/TrbF family protein [Longimicrobiaceae bacterium]